MPGPAVPPATSERGPPTHSRPPASTPRRSLHAPFRTLAATDRGHCPCWKAGRVYPVVLTGKAGRAFTIFRWRASRRHGINHNVLSLSRVRAHDQKNSHLPHACCRHRRGAIFGGQSTNPLLLCQPAVLALSSGRGDPWHRSLDRHRTDPGGVLRLSPGSAILLPILRRPAGTAAAGQSAPDALLVATAVNA